MEKSTSFKAHIELTKENPPSDLLVEALVSVNHKGSALDLGGGGLKDARLLLKEGFGNVSVVDSDPSVQDLASDLANDRLKVNILPFKKFEFIENSYDIVNAQFSLPFNGPDGIEKLIDDIKKSLKDGGIFSGQLFGVNDEWNTSDTNISFQTKDEALAFFDDMELLSFKEVEKDSQTTDGEPKHWHVFHIVAKKVKRSTAE